MNPTYRRLAVVAIVVALVAFAFGPLFHAFVNQRLDLRAVNADVEQRQAAISELEGEIARWEDDAYVRQQARERLMFVEPGDQPYLVLDDRAPEDKNAEPTRPASAPETPSQGPTPEPSDTESTQTEVPETEAVDETESTVEGADEEADDERE